MCNLGASEGTDAILPPSLSLLRAPRSSAHSRHERKARASLGYCLGQGQRSLWESVRRAAWFCIGAKGKPGLERTCTGRPSRNPPLEEEELGVACWESTGPLAGKGRLRWGCIFRRRGVSAGASGGNRLENEFPARFSVLVLNNSYNFQGRV